ncbi:hypothetical protein BS47DRAFT_1380992 [Hydnum rufescens UP504]|uniref:Heme haloperoxidase family profile domain-containing protein n=1 Tax=Hydnum rufescens UP504 TaxID=1448309 RepID=A0A9P6B3B9_9AGAM|nr:hypothetical protein BS47DRAFT_1380992 [Hydnum rufescens UP504]
MIYLVDRLRLLSKLTGWALLKLPLSLLSIVVWLGKKLQGLLVFLGLLIWDFGLSLSNVVTPRLKKGSVVKEGKAGYKRIWPEFIQRQPGDSRSPCPGLNALANHGILPRDGRNITKEMFQKALEDAFNFSPTLTRNTTNTVEALYGHSVIDLEHLCCHNIIEHDGSLTRRDAWFEPNQTIPDRHLIEDLLNSASGPVSAEHPEGHITPMDLSRQLSLRFAHSKKENPVFSISTSQKFFAASNSSLLYEVFHGDVATLRTVLNEERLPENFETSLRTRNGYTILDFTLRSIEIALGVHTVKL